MAYNYGFPATYQPQMYPSYSYPQVGFNNGYQQSFNNQPQAQSIMVCTWVQGEAAAKAFPLNPGQNAVLMDSEGECFYIKSVDGSGMPSPLRTFEYHEIINPQQSTMSPISNNQQADFVSRSEYEELKKELEELKNSKPVFSNEQSKSPQKYGSNNK